MEAEGSPCNWIIRRHFLKVANQYADFNLNHIVGREWQIIKKVYFSDFLPEKLFAFYTTTKSFPTEHLWDFFELAKGWKITHKEVIKSHLTSVSTARY